ncbi:hypothetical protein BDW71DRAFT_187427 [Aspergillus fruticulosus]
MRCLKDAAFPLFWRMGALQALALRGVSKQCNISVLPGGLFLLLGAVCLSVSAGIDCVSSDSVPTGTQW